MARQELPTEDAESLPAPLRDRRNVIECKWNAGMCTSSFGFVAGFPVRFYVGGVGGNRLLGMCPMPIPPFPAVSGEFPDGRLSGRFDGHGRCVLLRVGESCPTGEAPMTLDRMRARFARIVSVKPGFA